MTILVTGATGHVGRHVVSQLAARGERVRAMSRNPATAGVPAGVEVVGGDLLDVPSVTRALAGAHRLYLFPEPRTAVEVVAAAVRAGVRRIVTLSSGAVTGGLDTDFQLPVEQAVEASGCEWTHLRPGEFASNTLRLWGPSIRAERVVRHHQPDWRGLPTHEADIAAVGVEALLGEGHHGRAYDLTGPHRLSAREQARLIGEALGEPIRVETVTAEQSRRILRAQGGWAAENADFLTGFESYSPSDVPEFTAEEWDRMLEPLPTVERVLGRPAHTFARWATDHAKDFR
ncbi:NmrA family transcriptional regulator [Actinophytocola xinjiangensis]|uniref:NmrA family transcriptional regulator n=1 Tax=Actinophytocola xinjiangensis TaxID=485602 RepID=A0A7Z1B1E7_9PSEU|nr:NAD(P)H-binding protein [Actinophytocola xinjiangensis]OLF13792.1 NmrA family transcriptional regulator [Actinophytocola xinjiangensis]